MKATTQILVLAALVGCVAAAPAPGLPITTNDGVTDPVSLPPLGPHPTPVLPNFRKYPWTTLRWPPPTFTLPVITPPPWKTPDFGDYGPWIPGPIDGPVVDPKGPIINPKAPIKKRDVGEDISISSESYPDISRRWNWPWETNDEDNQREYDILYGELSGYLQCYARDTGLSHDDKVKRCAKKRSIEPSLLEDGFNACYASYPTARDTGLSLDEHMKRCMKKRSIEASLEGGGFEGYKEYVTVKV